MGNMILRTFYDERDLQSHLLRRKSEERQIERATDQLIQNKTLFEDVKKRIEYQRQYAKDHPEKVKEYKRTCYLNNKEKYDAWHKKIVKCEHCGIELQKRVIIKTY